MNWNAEWICPPQDMGDVVPNFSKFFSISKPVKKAVLAITALGVYQASLNGKRIGDFILAPGWTVYEQRLQIQQYDITSLVSERNTLEILVGKGWYRSRLIGWQNSPRQKKYQKQPAGLTLTLTISYQDGTSDVLMSDDTWKVSESNVRFSEIYDGEIYDASFHKASEVSAISFDGPTNSLIPQEGEDICEQERIAAKCIFTTPSGETVLDFGQELTGYPEITLSNACAGERVNLSFAEVLDKNGNFYNENYRSAKAQYIYTCTDGAQCYKPLLTFYGFRYVRINEFPGGVQSASPEQFTAIQVNSNIRQTGSICTSNPMLNQLFSNIIWGQKCNFVDVPTDCPQRDERQGWTGDAQVFIRTACYNFDTERFYMKWLSDLSADQRSDGAVGFVIPDLLMADNPSAAWGDAATVCPWELYLAFGNPDILKHQFDSMKRWVDYITHATTTPGLWTGGEHFGDWLGLDAPSGSYKGSSRQDLIASAFYAHSTNLLVKAGRVLHKDISVYEQLHESIIKAFRLAFPEYLTQTECVLAIRFELAEDPQKTADQLAQMIKAADISLTTGFVGTPYLLHVLSDYGYSDLAWSLLLRTKYPSWLYPITKGATTMWEHWDGIKPDGEFWSSDMNSFNHYAYGAVADWLYGAAAGIKPAEPGYTKAIIAPIPDQRLSWFEGKLETRHGKICSTWRKTGNGFRYDIETPVATKICISGKWRDVPAGKYIFFSK